MNNFYLYRFEGTTVNTIVPWDKSEAFKGGISHSIWRTSTMCRHGSRTSS